MGIMAVIAASILDPGVYFAMNAPPAIVGSGLESVDRQTIDAARAMGMTERQILARVEIPLSLPLLVGGVRSAVLQVVATATVAAYIGLGGLGRYVIDAIRNRDYPIVQAVIVLIAGIYVILNLLVNALDGMALVVRQVAVTPGSPTKEDNRRTLQARSRYIR